MAGAESLCGLIRFPVAVLRRFGAGRTEKGGLGVERRRVKERIVTGVLAGLVAGVTIDCYLLTMLLVFEHGTVGGFYRFVASGLVGKAAAANPGAVPLGVAVHFVVSACWGVGYAYVASTTPQLNARPLLSGAVYGVVVLLAMLLIEVGANIFTLPRGNYDLFNLIVSHTLFFGIPVAYIVASRMKRPAAT